MGVRQFVWQCWLASFHKPNRLQFGIVALESTAGNASSFTLNSVGVRTWSLPVVGSLPKVSSVALIV